ncbi:hypothetical protein 1 [Hubei sobemo-like virus 35]|uniref:hypothetical protein 1 n=1 Tax=Hubei sobemo-like virus 35 TaxID=1923222 RepID=UPI00090BFE1A|nr:hypothetical protein 1 [Hubei sobemo-like virus 35]APG75776.1 hypothetical protein 1 [Hubei sobemo-like virus 35]
MESIKQLALETLQNAGQLQLVGCLIILAVVVSNRRLITFPMVPLALWLILWDTRERIVYRPVMPDFSWVQAWVLMASESFQRAFEASKAYMMGVIGVMVLLRVWISLRQSLKEVSLRLRGVTRVQYEAMREGSAFEKAPIPACQVQICEAGLFVNSHLGYGIRVENCLVVPRHVLLAGKWPTNKLIISVPLRPSMVLEGRMEESQKFDLAYFFLGEAQWAALGAKKATLTASSLQGRASCAGYAGLSRGDLKKTNSVGQYSYGGSTKAGYSGAAYVMQGQVAGIHIGVDCEVNVGLSSRLIAKELEYLTVTEARRNHGVSGLAAYDTPVQLVETHDNWQDLDIEELMYASRSGDERATEWLRKNQHKHKKHPMYWESMKQALPSMDPETLLQVQNAFNKAFTFLQEETCSCSGLLHACEGKRGKVIDQRPSTSRVIGQSDVPQEAEQGLTETPLHRANMLKRIESLEENEKILVESVSNMDENVKDLRGNVTQIDDDIYKIYGRIAFLEERLQNVELWAIDRGFANLPAALFSEDSPQVVAQKRRTSKNPAIPLVERISALKLKAYGESTKPRKIVTPPLIRKVRDAIATRTQSKNVEVELEHISAAEEAREKMSSMTQKQQRERYKELRNKQNLTPEEEQFKQQHLESRRKRNARRRTGKKSTGNSRSTSSSSGKNEPSTSTQ